MIGIETALDAGGERKLLDDVGSPAVRTHFNFANALQNGRDLHRVGLRGRLFDRRRLGHGRLGGGGRLRRHHRLGRRSGHHARRGRILLAGAGQEQLDAGRRAAHVADHAVLTDAREVGGKEARAELMRDVDLRAHDPGAHTSAGEAFAADVPRHRLGGHATVEDHAAVGREADLLDVEHHGIFARRLEQPGADPRAGPPPGDVGLGARYRQRRRHGRPGVRGRARGEKRQRSHHQQRTHKPSPGAGCARGRPQRTARATTEVRCHTHLAGRATGPASTWLRCPCQAGRRASTSGGCRT